MIPPLAFAIGFVCGIIAQIYLDLSGTAPEAVCRRGDGVFEAAFTRRFVAMLISSRY